MRPPRIGRRGSALDIAGKRAKLLVCAYTIFLYYLSRASPFANDVLYLVDKFLKANVLSWLYWSACVDAPRLAPPSLSLLLVLESIPAQDEKSSFMENIRKVTEPVRKIFQLKKNVRLVTFSEEAAYFKNGVADSHRTRVRVGFNIST